MEVDSRPVELAILEPAAEFAGVETPLEAAAVVPVTLEVANPAVEHVDSEPSHSTDSGELEQRESAVSTLSNSNSNSTSISSITISPPSQFIADEFPKSFSPSHQKKPATDASKGKASPHKAPTVEQTLDKKLSFRTDSTGSMGSLVSGLDLSVSTIPEEHSDEDEDSPQKSKFNQNNISSASILVSALKQKRQIRKKSVSFSLPSADDISRRAKKSTQALLFTAAALNDFDDNIADYQISSPKAAEERSATKPRPYSSPTRSGKYSNVIEVQDLGETVGIATHSPTTSGRELFSSSPDLPPRPSHSRESSGDGMRHSSPGAHDENSSPAPRQHIHLHSLAIANNHANNQHNSHKQHPLPLPHIHIPHTLHNHSEKSHHAGAVHQAHDHNGDATPADMPPPPPQASLMQRICEAKNPSELCTVFGIASESVFTGENMKKRFSKDLTAKGRVVWIVPKTKSIHWAKNTKDQSANIKVKHFLLDKNSPHLNGNMGSAAISTAGGAEVPLNASTTTTTTSSSASAAATTTAPDAATSKEGTATDAGAEEEGAAEHKSSGTTTDPPAASGAQETAGLDGQRDEKAGSSSYTVGRAQGELLGVIHSAVISHLTIKIHTESGEYLCLTISSGPNAVQRAKDWFSVIKTLTKDVQ